MIKTITKIFIILLVLQLSSCQIFPSSYTSLRAKSGIISKDFRVEEPFNFDYRLIVVKAIIQGKEFDFIFDTGASNTILSKEAADAIGLKDRGGSYTRDSQGNRQRLMLGLIDTISIGGVAFKDISVSVIDWPENSAVECIGKDGLIGNNLIRHCNWLIDYEKKIMTISDGDLSMDNITFTPMKTANIRPRLDIKMNDISFENVLLDLGSGGNFDISRGIAANKSINPKDYKHIRNLDGSSQGLFGSRTDSVSLMKADSISLGAFVIHNTSFEIEKKSGSKIGNQLLRHCRVYLDYRNQRLGFSPYELETRLKTKNTIGFSPSLNNEGLYIASIHLNGQADRKGLTYGDKILSLNGKGASDFTTYCDFFNFIYNDVSKGDSLLVIMEANPEEKLIFNKELLWED